MNIDLRSCRHVVVLSRLLSYTRAAQELCLTQSALTRSIQAIERQAGTRLFDRDRGGVHPTAVGRAFVERAAALLRDADELARLLERSTDAQVGEVSFGMGPLAAQALLPAVLPRIFTSRPELRTHVMVRNIDTLLPSALQEQIEFFICPEGPVPASAPLQRSILGWFPMSLLVRDGHPLLAASRPGEPGAYPLISPGPFNMIENWPRYCRPYLAGPLHVIEDYGVASRITEQTDAIWLGSAFAASLELRSGRLREIPVPRGQRPVRFRMVLYHPDKRSLSPAAMILKDLFQERIRALGNEVAALE
jgi:DNA-binding transcriptional LysR family regulator